MMWDIAFGIIISSSVVAACSGVNDILIEYLNKRYLPDEYDNYMGSPYNIPSFIKAYKLNKEVDKWETSIPEILIYKNVELKREYGNYSYKYKNSAYSNFSKWDLYRTMKRPGNGLEYKELRDAITEHLKAAKYKEDMKQIAEET